MGLLGFIGFLVWTLRVLVSGMAAAERVLIERAVGLAAVLVGRLVFAAAADFLVLGVCFVARGLSGVFLRVGGFAALGVFLQVVASCVA